MSEHSPAWLHRAAQPATRRATGRTSFVIGLGLLLAFAPAAWGADLVVDGTAITIETDTEVTGNVFVQNGGVLTVRNATLMLRLQHDEQYHIDVSGGSQLILQNATITSSGGQYWIELTSDEAGPARLEVSGTTLVTNHSGIRPFGASQISVTGGDVEELQVRERTVAAVTNASAYLVMFFEDQAATLDGLDVGPGITKALSVPGGWSLTLTNAMIGGYQIDLVGAADVTVKNGDGIVLSIHTPGTLGPDLRIIDGVTSPTPSSGSVTALGPRFTYENSNIALINVYTAGTDQVLLRNMHVNEVNAMDGSRLVIGQPGFTTLLNCNLCQAYDTATFEVDSATINATDNLPSATCCFHQSPTVPVGQGVMTFRNTDVRDLHLTAIEQGTINLCSVPFDPGRLSVLDPAATISTTCSPALRLTLAVNTMSVGLGGVLALSATVLPGDSPPTVDAYLAVQLPNGVRLFLQPDGTFRSDVRPLLTGWPATSFSGEVLRYTFTGVEPAGDYTFLAAFVDPGTGQIVSGIAQARSTFAP